MSEKISVVILGGGTAGWMFASALASKCKSAISEVVLIESDEIGTIGVGEATLPQIKEFNDYIGVDEADMMRATNATFKLGIEFENWGKLDSRYIHPFGTYGPKSGGVDFLQYWVRLNQEQKAKPLEAYSYAIQLSRAKRFSFPDENPELISSTYSYAYHLDASAYAAYLRKKFTGNLLKRVEGKVVEVNTDNNTGAISSLKLESGQVVGGDFFIDCSGFSSLLMEKTLNIPFESWSKWLPCDRAVAIPSESDETLRPYTRASALDAGWKWNIPLQHRTGNGYVYCSDFVDNEGAYKTLQDNLSAKPLADPNFIQLKAGKRKFSWHKNCLAVGLAGGFLEPLESTSLYLIQMAVMRFIEVFSADLNDPVLIREYNRLLDIEFERVRDFLILHYHLSQREDSDFWRHYKTIDIPDSLKEKLFLFEHRAFVEDYHYGLFSPASWISVFVGQGLQPGGYNPCFSGSETENIQNKLDSIANDIQQRVQMISMHDEFIRHYCAGGVN